MSNSKKPVTYALEIENKKDREIKISKLGKVYFRSGCYVYVGSARKNMISRIKRHLSKDKKLFWHIDYFLKEEDLEIRKVWVTSIEECKLASMILSIATPVVGFGCSDCRCSSHLFFIDNRRDWKRVSKRNLCKVKFDEIQI